MGEHRTSRRWQVGYPSNCSVGLRGMSCPNLCNRVNAPCVIAVLDLSTSLTPGTPPRSPPESSLRRGGLAHPLAGHDDEDSCRPPPGRRRVEPSVLVLGRITTDFTFVTPTATVLSVRVWAIAQLSVGRKRERRSVDGARRCAGIGRLVRTGATHPDISGSVVEQGAANVQRSTATFHARLPQSRPQSGTPEPILR